VTRGEHEPTDQEADWPSEDEEEEDEGAPAEGAKEKAEPEKTDGEIVKGVPSFWLTIFKNVEMLAEMVQEADEPVLEALQDVTVKFSESNPMGFTLFFHFGKNEFFSNTVLTKQYEMRCVPEEDDPFTFEGPEIFKCVGSIIDWQPGKNLTVKQVRSVKQLCLDQSCFCPGEEEAEAQEQGQRAHGDQASQGRQLLQLLLAARRAGRPEGRGGRGHAGAAHRRLRDRPLHPRANCAKVKRALYFYYITCRAVLFFTGEALEDEGDDDEEESDEDEDGDDDSENDEDFDPSKAKANPECKQQ
jgi:nucleosome assembly protein 1-like 1